MPVLRDLISSTKKILTLEAAGKTFLEELEWLKQRLYKAHTYKPIKRLNLKNYPYEKEKYNGAESFWYPENSVETNVFLCLTETFEGLL